jgi:hypothetical protein
MSSLPQQPTLSPANENNDSTLSVGAIVGIAIGCCVVSTLAIFITVSVLHKRRLSSAQAWMESQRAQEMGHMIPYTALNSN